MKAALTARAVITVIAICSGALIVGAGAGVEDGRSQMCTELGGTYSDNRCALTVKEK